jgi:hypothetical protein|tara:strand:+ start:174 stop:371 length:198 start_codon:yes stop_codon:yes gene_type:complete
MNNKVQVQVPVPITMLSDQAIINELNRRDAKVKWTKNTLTECKPKDRVKLGLSPSTKIEEWDCRK